MTARVFTFDGDWIGARVRRRMRGWIEEIPAETGDLVALQTRPSIARFVSIYEYRDHSRWTVLGLHDWQDAKFADLDGALTYARGIAQPAGARVEVYRRDRELSA